MEGQDKENNDTFPHAGINQGLKIALLSGFEGKGVQVALHNQFDVPLMGVNSFFVEAGSHSMVKTGISMSENPGHWCFDNEEEFNRPTKNGKLLQDFKYDYAKDYAFLYLQILAWTTDLEVVSVHRIAFMTT